MTKPRITIRQDGFIPHKEGEPCPDAQRLYEFEIYTEGSAALVLYPYFQAGWATPKSWWQNPPGRTRITAYRIVR